MPDLEHISEHHRCLTQACEGPGPCLAHDNSLCAAHCTHAFGAEPPRMQMTRAGHGGSQLLMPWGCGTNSALLACWSWAAQIVL